jgi:hypothetical protein
MDPLTAVVVWGASLAGIAALVRVASRAGRSAGNANTDLDE